jgi:hypothetical protein
MATHLRLIKCVRIGDNRLKVANHFSFGEEREICVVKDVKPIKLSPTKDDNVSRLRVYLHLATPIGRYPGATKEPRILIHVERDATDAIRLKNPSPQIMDETQ